MISFRPFRELMTKRNITSYRLRNKCGPNNLDGKTLLRLMNDESVSTNTINSICNIFKCDLTDVMEYFPDQNTDGKDNP